MLRYVRYVLCYAGVMPVSLVYLGHITACVPHQTPSVCVSHRLTPSPPPPPPVCPAAGAAGGVSETDRQPRQRPPRLHHRLRPVRVAARVSTSVATIPGGGGGARLHHRLRPVRVAARVSTSVATVPGGGGGGTTASLSSPPCSSRCPSEYL